MPCKFFQASCREPYRLLFPLGFIFLLVGVGLWSGVQVFAGFYPAPWHRPMMLQGFMGFFIAGFLMTAIPQFSKTNRASAGEVGFYIFITLSGIFSTLWLKPEFRYLTQGLQSLSLIIFVLRRLFVRQENPPFTFVFVLAGLFLSFSTSILEFFHMATLPRSIHHELLFSFLILGVGSRLIPGILGHVEIVQAQRSVYENLQPLRKIIPWYFYLLIILMFLSFLFPHPLGPTLKLMIYFFIAFKFWRLHKFPKNRVTLTWCLWSSAWAIALFPLLQILWPSGSAHATHFFFILGVTLLTLLISTRVIRSHGAAPVSLENGKFLAFFTCLLFLAAAIRISSVFFANYYLQLLSLSSVTLIIGAVIWAFIFKWIGKTPESEENC